MINNTPTSKSLLILLWNANGIHNYIAELSLVLHDKRIDIALISETHLTKTTKIHIPDYTILRSNHLDNTARGGAATIIKSTIIFYNVSQLSETHIQSFTIQITLNHSPISQVFNPNVPTIPSKENKIINFLDIPLPMTLPPKPFTPNGVKSFIQKFPLGKSPGHDLITA